MTLRVGHITYLNCVPFFHNLREAGFEGEIIGGVPSRLNAMLAAGEIDLSPSSSFEYALHWQDYLLLPGLSISSRGPVKSVLLFSPIPLEDLESQEIVLTGESATSVNLLRVLLWEYVGLRSVRFAVPEQPVEDLIRQGKPALLIGDRALKVAKMRPRGCQIYDLGELWCQFTGLPFVFALWIVRREAAEKKTAEIAALAMQLENALALAQSSMDEIACQRPEREWLSQLEIRDYWQSMSFGLTPDHQQGLEFFFRLGHRYGLLPGIPELSFFTGECERLKGIKFA